LLAILIVTLIWLFDIRREKLLKYRKSIPIVFVGSNLLFLFIFYLITYGYFDNLFEEYIGLTPNYIFMGRINIYREILDQFNAIPLIGRGFGFTSNFLEANSLNLVLLHSDVLKIFLELGAIPFIIFWYMLYSKSLKSTESFMIVVYYNVLSLTDNISIYFEFMFLLLVIWFYFRDVKGRVYFQDQIQKNYSFQLYDSIKNK
jgi:hypothetical protein